MAIIVKRNGDERVSGLTYRPLALFDEIDTLARNLWESWTPFSFENALVPRSDIYEEKGELVFKTELPGVEAKDVDLTITGDRLTLKAEKKEEVKEDTTSHTRECHYGQYWRSMTLPYPVKEDGIKATFNNGVLELRLPKADEVKERKIEIKAQLHPNATKKPRKTNAKKS